MPRILGKNGERRRRTHCEARRTPKKTHDLKASQPNKVGIKMISVYVLGKILPGTENEVLSSLKNISQVRTASLTYGIYDLYIEALCNSLDDLDDFIVNVVRKIPGIKETVTLVASRSIHPPMDF